MVDGSVRAGKPGTERVRRSAKERECRSEATAESERKKHASEGISEGISGSSRGRALCGKRMLGRQQMADDDDDDDERGPRQQGLKQGREGEREGQCWMFVQTAS